MKLPTKEQIEVAAETLKKAHANFGYRRPLNDRYAQVIVWTAFFAISLQDTDDKRSPLK